MRGNFLVIPVIVLLSLQAGAGAFDVKGFAKKQRLCYVVLLVGCLDDTDSTFTNY
jgi:hypothetical protein